MGILSYRWVTLHITALATAWQRFPKSRRGSLASGCAHVALRYNVERWGMNLLTSPGKLPNIQLSQYETVLLPHRSSSLQRDNLSLFARAGLGVISVSTRRDHSLFLLSVETGLGYKI